MKKIIIIVIILALAGLGYLFITKTPQAVQEDIVASVPQVETLTVGDLSAQTAPIIGYGQVVSSNSVAVVPETSGVVKRVYKTLGQTVRAGETVVELQNSSEQQAVLQARSGVSSSQAQLSKSKQSADREDIVNQELDVNNKKTDLNEKQLAITQLADTIQISINNSAQSSYDQFFYDGTTDPQLRFSVRDTSDARRLEAERSELSRTINEFAERIPDATSYSRAIALLDDTEDLIDSYLATLTSFSSVVSSQPTSIVSQEVQDQRLSVIRSIRQPILSLKNQVSLERISLESAKNALAISENNLAKLQEGPEVEDVQIAESGLDSSRSNLASAQIQLSKTFIKAPTFGRISSIETRVGQLVGPSAPIFVLSSSDAKRVDVYLTEKDVAQIQVGSSVVIDGEYSGTVARIAPTIDAQTGKIKVEIFATDTITLTEGVGVGVAIERNSTTGGFSIPIEAVFVRGDQAYVYAVVKGRAVPTPVETDGLFGPVVVVNEGVTGDTEIVSFARIVKDNQIISFVEASVNELVDIIDADQEAATSSEVTE